MFSVSVAWWASKKEDFFLSLRWSYTDQDCECEKGNAGKIIHIICETYYR